MLDQVSLDGLLIDTLNLESHGLRPAEREICHW